MSLDPQYENRSDEVMYEEKSLYDWKQCHIDKVFYPQLQMVYDKDGSNWIHRSNLKEYLKDFEGQMLAEDYNKLKLNLMKQLI
jgi:hypothetical protein